jgi:hypothetical protein
MNVPATPEHHLRELRKKRKRERRRFRRFMRRTGRRLSDWKTRAELVNRLERADIRSPWLVLTEADRASRAADVGRGEFRAMAIVVLRKETGIPQRSIYGCDYGPRTDRPYCNQAVTVANAAPFIRWVLESPFGRMNGMHWTQTTWYTKLERVLKLGNPHLPQPHLRVCLGDLADLRHAYGQREAFERYNGSGPAAEEYARICVSWMPWAHGLLD